MGRVYYVDRVLCGQGVLLIPGRWVPPPTVPTSIEGMVTLTYEEGRE